ncbi:hypothetical protein Pmani_013374 [Petrolisthes manimaculis]|uniref:Uncharacterized protein n=1 Tax=Petrolisthes manimaculis TaxID=1843537 RepID=A0AAE1PW62_9EUCA|nr:hypothetical protein Pmani_013374 [Petrolisthes manimaculis]
MKIEKRQDKLEKKVGELDDVVSGKFDKVSKEMVEVKGKVDKGMEEMREKLEELDTERNRDLETVKRGFVNMKDMIMSEIKEEVISQVKGDVGKISGDMARAEAQKNL